MSLTIVIILFVAVLAFLLAALVAGLRKNDPPRYVDRNVLFTAYRPEVIAPGRWYKLLAVAHISRRRDDAPPGAPDPEQEVSRVVNSIYGSSAAGQMVTQQQTAAGIPERQTITLVPRVEGVEFNPGRQQFIWLRDVHHAVFEMRAPEGTPEGTWLEGALTVYAGGIILADVPLSFRVDTARADAAPPESAVGGNTAAPYAKIFASYSRRDREVVEQFESFVEALGHRYLRDVYAIRSGERWDEALASLIDEADVFQLFWSSSSMDSEFVRRECEYALSKGRPNFVRPVYWEEPFPEGPGRPPEELAKIHFHKFEPRRRALPTGLRPLALAGVAFVIVSIFAFMPPAGMFVPGGLNINDSSPPVTPNAPPPSPRSTREFFLHQEIQRFGTYEEQSVRDRAFMRGDRIESGTLNAWIYEQVRLKIEAHTPSSDISVNVFDENVVLRGRVRSREEKVRAEEAAKDVLFVRWVINRIEVIPD